MESVATQELNGLFLMVAFIGLFTIAYLHAGKCG